MIGLLDITAYFRAMARADSRRATENERLTYKISRKIKEGYAPVTLLAVHARVRDFTQWQNCFQGQLISFEVCHYRHSFWLKRHSPSTTI